MFLSYYVPQNSLITNFHTGLDLLENRMVIFGCTVPLSRPRKHIKHVLLLQCHNCPDLARHMSGLSLQGVSFSITHIQAVQYISHVHSMQRWTLPVDRSR